MSDLKYRVAVCAICRNERNYIEEWVAFYKSLGFEGVFIYDNVSDDGTSELLASLHAVKELTRVHWPRKEGIPPQRDAYGHFLECYAQDYDYVLICDLDEFLVIDDGSVQSLIAEAEHVSPNVGAIAFPWLIFGSGGQLTETNELVIERFTKCDAKVARTVKTLFASKNTYNMRTHICDLLGGIYLDNALRTAEWDQRMPIKLKSPVAGKARIHHYYTKSKEEWLRRRAQPKADRAKLELKNIEEYEKYSALHTENLQGCALSAQVRPIIQELRSKVAGLQESVRNAEVELVSVSSEWLFGLIKNISSSTPVALRLSGETGDEVSINSKRISEDVHIFTYKNKWRKTYSKSFSLSLVGSDRTQSFTESDYPEAMNSLALLAKFMPSAEEHIFSIALLALSQRTSRQVFEFCNKIEFPRNRKFKRFFALLSVYEVSADKDAFRRELEKEDDDFKKMIFDRKKSPYISGLLC
ncbi:glycosyltransferase family 2 protein [Pseudomonas alloputida]|uniref:glycosyltransferase family 2 protein n=1 Tax=Pseudomonas TaxID=286 RepID=UPI00131A3B18|nr:glycosyltransferase family 2 protein [Pseudomonas sp. XWY-1]